MRKGMKLTVVARRLEGDYVKLRIVDTRSVRQQHLCPCLINQLRLEIREDMRWALVVATGYSRDRQS